MLFLELFTMAVFWAAAAAIFVQIFFPSFAEIFIPKEDTLVNTTTTATMNAARTTYSNNGKNNKKKKRKMTAKRMEIKFEQPRSNKSDWLLNMRTSMNNTTPHNKTMEMEKKRVTCGENVSRAFDKRACTTKCGPTLLRDKTTEKVILKKRVTFGEDVHCYFDKEEHPTKCGPALLEQRTDKSILKCVPGRKIPVDKKATADLEFGMKVMTRMEDLIPTTLHAMLSCGTDDWRVRRVYKKRTEDERKLERQARKLCANKMDFLGALDKELFAYGNFGLVGPILSVAQRVGVLDEVKVPRGRTEPMNERKHARTETTIQVRKVCDVEPCAKRRRMSGEPTFAIGSRCGMEAQKEKRRRVVERAKLRRRR